MWYQIIMLTENRNMRLILPSTDGKTDAFCLERVTDKLQTTKREGSWLQQLSNVLRMLIPACQSAL